ncbi:MAG: DUF4194 domain-containing protein [Verrucomicrobiota bacterium]
MSNVFDQKVDASENNLERPDDDASPTAQPPEPEDSTPLAVKRVVQELLRLGYLDEQSKVELFRLAITHRAQVNLALAPLDLEMQLDEHRGLAFLTVIKEADTPTATDTDPSWSHPLVRKKPLTLEQSLVIAILRQSYALHEQETGVGGNALKLPVDEIMHQFLTYYGDSGSDSKNRNHLGRILENLKTHGIVSEVDKNDELTVRPLIAHIANPASLSALLDVLKQKQQNA